MIQRIRVPGPDGDIIKDRYLGGGPLGETDVRMVRYVHEPDAIHASPVGHMLTNPMKLDINESKKAAQRRWLQKQKARA